MYVLAKQFSLLPSLSTFLAHTHYHLRVLLYVQFYEQGFETQTRYSCSYLHRAVEPRREVCERTLCGVWREHSSEFSLSDESANTFIGRSSCYYSLARRRHSIILSFICIFLTNQVALNDKFLERIFPQNYR
jgi:hypothetical protein